MNVLTALLGALGVFTVLHVATWWIGTRRARDAPSASPEAAARGGPSGPALGIGFVTNFFDTLGIGSFAPTTSLFKFFRLVPDQLIPGTLNVGDTLPAIAEAFIYTAVIEVSPRVLVSMILAAMAGAWLGAGVVAGWPKRRIQLGMGSALLVAAGFFVYRNLGGTGTEAGATDLHGVAFLLGIAGNFALGALMTMGIGLYAPCMVLVGLLGMNAKAAFPIMMGSCAFLMPISSARFIHKHAYARRTALGLALGGVPGVLVAAYVVKSLDVSSVRWLVTVVVVIAAVVMLKPDGMRKLEGRSQK